MYTFGNRKERVVQIDSRYSVSDRGVVYSGGLPLEPVRGVGVNLHGKRVKVAYLVARAFVPNQECRQWVRHRNGNVEDNRAENLEWCDEKEEKRRGRKPMECWVRAWTAMGDPVGVWKNLQEAGDATGAAVGAIRACLSGKRKTAGGLVWGRA